MSTGGCLKYYPINFRREEEQAGVLGISLATALGFGAGIVTGLVLGEWLGVVHPERVRRILGGTPDEPATPEQVEREVLRAFRNTSATRRLNLSARAIAGGIIELTGIVPDERTRQVAGDTATRIAGGDIVVNRILVQGRDVPPGHIAPTVGE